MTSTRLALGGSTAAAVVAVDQLTKTWALRTLSDEPIHVIGTLQLNLSFNTGAAFGLGKGLAPLFMVGAIAVLVAVIGFGRSAATTPAAVVALGLVVGGALGNLADRFLRDHGGAVVDFLDLQWWPIFNVADVAITLGAALLILSGFSTEARATAGTGS